MDNAREKYKPKFGGTNKPEKSAVPKALSELLKTYEGSIREDRVKKKITFYSSPIIPKMRAH